MRTLILLFVATSLAACSDETKDEADPSTTEPTTEPTTGVGDDDDDSSMSGDDDDDSSMSGDDDDDSSTTGDDDDDTTTWGAPDIFEGRDCPNGVQATWLSGELIVFSDQAAAIGELDVPVPGIYHLYDTSVAESGAGQTNESAFLRIPNAADPVGYPSSYGLLNCGYDYVALDNDNVKPPASNALQYLGTFSLEAGVNTVEFHHYCELWFEGECPQFHDTLGTPCDAGINSVHFLGDAVCLVPVY